MAAPQLKHTVERDRQALNGWLALALVVLWFVAALALFIATAERIDAGTLSQQATAFRMIGAFLMGGLGLFSCFGFFTLEPNEARVLMLFGAYKGTVRSSGFHWANPLYARSRGTAPNSSPASVAKKMLGEGATQTKFKTKLSLRVRNFNSDDAEGERQARQPRRDRGRRRLARRGHGAGRCSTSRTTRATCRCRANPRSAASRACMPTITARSDEATLARRRRRGRARARSRNSQVRLKKAGVVVDEARLTHLAYAPEIAPAMLRRQQAEAVIAARQKIVHGAVSMVEMALQRARGEERRRSSTRSARPRWSATCSSCCAGPRRLRPSSIPARCTTDSWRKSESRSCSVCRPSSGRSSRNGRRTSCAASTGRSSTCYGRRSRSDGPTSRKATSRTALVRGAHVGRMRL